MPTAFQASSYSLLGCASCSACSPSPPSVRASSRGTRPSRCACVIHDNAGQANVAVLNLPPTAPAPAGPSRGDGGTCAARLSGIPPPPPSPHASTLVHPLFHLPQQARELLGQSLAMCCPTPSLPHSPAPGLVAYLSGVRNSPCPMPSASTQGSAPLSCLLLYPSGITPASRTASPTQGMPLVPHPAACSPPPHPHTASTPAQPATPTPYCRTLPVSLPADRQLSARTVPVPLRTAPTQLRPPPPRTGTGPRRGVRTPCPTIPHPPGNPPGYNGEVVTHAIRRRRLLPSSPFQSHAFQSLRGPSLCSPTGTTLCIKPTLSCCISTQAICRYKCNSSLFPHCSSTGTTSWPSTPSTTTAATWRTTRRCGLAESVV